MKTTVCFTIKLTINRLCRAEENEKAVARFMRWMG
jgi:hypothetical protein